jgi:phage replication O-like protein O
MEIKYTQIPNELFEIIPRLHLSGTEYDILLVVLRKTLGFHKETDWISYSQFIMLTGKSKFSVWKSLKSLVSKNLLVSKTKLGKMAMYGLNMDFSKIKLLVSKTKLVSNSKPTSKQKLTGLVSKTYHTKETITKENTTKEIVTRENKYPKLENLKENDFQEIADYYKCSLAFVRSKYDDMFNWAGSKPNNPRLIGRNWRLTLMKFVKDDLVKMAERRAQNGNKRGVDARNIR